MAAGIGLTDGNISYQHSKIHSTLCWALERPNLDAMLIIKGRLTRDFQFSTFSRISFSRAPEYPIGVISNFYENSRTI
jgi:hypothetical protein